MSGTRPRFAFSPSFSDGSGMSNDMLNNLFPDSLWKYGTLTEPEEETYLYEEKPKTRRKPKTNRKNIKRITRKRARPSKPKATQRPKKRKKLDMVKLRQRRLNKLISELPTAAEYQRRRKKLALEKKRRLKVAERMLKKAKELKAKELVKARQERLKRLLAELPSSAAHHRRVGRPVVTRAKKRELAERKKVRDMIQMWKRRAAKLRAEEAASLKVVQFSRNRMKPAAMPAAKAAPFKHYYS
jgi:hypothetical protein